MPASLKEVLGDLCKTPGVVAALVVGRDGFLIEGLTAEGADLEALGAIASSVLVGSESLGKDMSLGAPHSLLMEFEIGPVAVSGVNGDAVLVVMGNRLCNLGRLRVEAKKALEAVAQCL